ncbi:MAG: hypothetical protein FWE57_02050 [Chitinispirillia bacterium]|nr:hypothetical protein [Chitinispirillia bacterium]
MELYHPKKLLIILQLRLHNDVNFVIIDEYDHFANNLIAMGKNYKTEVKAGGIVRSFYENFKILIF